MLLCIFTFNLGHYYIIIGFTHFHLNGTSIHLNGGAIQMNGTLIHLKFSESKQKPYFPYVF